MQSEQLLGCEASCGALLGHDNTNNKAVKTKSFGENEDEDHDHEKLLLLTNRTNTSITDHTNSHTSGKATESTAKTSGEVSKTSVSRVLGTADEDVGDGTSSGVVGSGKLVYARGNRFIN